MNMPFQKFADVLENGFVRSRAKIRPPAGVDRLKPAPPLQANYVPLVAQAVSPASYFISQLPRVRSASFTEEAGS